MGSSSERPAEDRRELSREAGNGTQSVGPGAGRPTPARFAPRRAQAAAPGPRRRNCGPSARGVEGIAQGPTSRIARGAQRGTSSPQEAASAGPLRLSPGQRGRGLPGCFGLAVSRVCPPFNLRQVLPVCRGSVSLEPDQSLQPLSRRLSDVSDEVTENSLSCRAEAAADSEMLQLLKLGARCAPKLRPSKPGTRCLQSSRGPRSSRPLRAWLCLTLPTLGAPPPALGVPGGLSVACLFRDSGRVCPAWSEGRKRG